MNRAVRLHKCRFAALTLFLGLLIAGCGGGGRAHNEAPVANAGQPQEVLVGATVSLNGSGSSDADGDPLTFAWSFTSTPTRSAAQLANPASATPSFTADVPGNYVVSLAVNDGKVSSAASTVTVTAKAANSAPVANPGPNRSVLLGTTVTFDGTASSDPDGDPLTYDWQVTGRPWLSTASFSDPTSPTPTFTPDLTGIYGFILIVRDGQRESEPVAFTLTVVRGNAVPSATVERVPTVRPDTLVVLDGHRSRDYDGDPLTYAWSMTSRPPGSNASLTNPTSVTPSFTADVVGTYGVSLVVNDGKEDSIPAIVTVSCATLQSIAVTGVLKTGVGITRVMTATGTFSDGNTARVTSGVTWTSLAPSIATVAGEGLVTGVALGTTTITATVDALSASGSLTVTSDEWTPAASLSAARAGPALLLSTGNVLVLGGDGSPISPYQSNEIYDPASDTWTVSGGAMVNAARIDFSTTVLADGKVLVAGGYRGSTTFATTEIYDPVLDEWSPAASMSVARYGQRAALLADGRVLVFGGTGSCVTCSLASAEIYDPVSNTWSPAASMPAGTFGEYVTRLPDGKLFVLGGGSVHFYDPVTDSWSSGRSMITPRQQFGAAQLANGKVLVVAGAGPTSRLTSAEIYDPAGDTWSSAADANVARLSPSLAVLANGKVIAAGGYGVGAYVASTEIYDPVANTWSTVASMDTARSASLVVLPNQSVLTVGGTTDTGRTASCELYW
jgi:N-acetylneuraminic acid mutarotase